jgi:hypothetical protein
MKISRGGQRIVLEPPLDGPIAAADFALAAESGDVNVAELRRRAREDEPRAEERRGR